MSLFKSYKIVVVEDEPIILENIIRKIEDINPLFNIVGNAQNGIDAISIIDSVMPDILLTDIQMPKMNGLELIRSVKNKYPNMQIIILSGYNEFEDAREAIKLGVTDYLLKPLSMESLKETLNNVTDKLDSTTSIVEREILFSGLNGLQYTKELPHIIKDMKLVIFIICIGNLCNQIPSDMLIKKFHHLWSQIEWSHILPQNKKYWIIDEKCPNQKCLILATDIVGADPIAISESEYYMFSLKLESALAEIINPIPVNICVCDSSIQYSEISSVAQKLRLLLDQSIIIGKSAVFSPVRPNKFDIAPAILDLTFQNKILAIVNQGNKVLLKQALYSQFDKWEQSRYPQRWIEQMLHQLIKLFQRQFPSVTEDEIMQMEYGLIENMAIFPDFSHLYENIWYIINAIIVSERDSKSDNQELINRIEEYLKANYSSNLCIEEISRKFIFNPTYLTKLFKRYKNETPTKYIILLRINEAKRLIETASGLDIKAIGEIVGYADQHYFSRIFKGITGMTPSEYRGSVARK